MTGDTIALELQGRRSGAGWVCRCPAHDDRSPSLSIRERDGKVLAHCHAGCAQSDVIAALRARGLWPERERQEWAPAERRQWARQRRELERILPVARLWRRAAVALAEETLVNLKSELSDRSSLQVEFGKIAEWTSRLAALERMTGADLVAEYRSFAKRDSVLAKEIGSRWKKLRIADATRTGLADRGMEHGCGRMSLRWPTRP